MARKRRRRGGMSGMRKAIRRFGSAAGSFVMLGPVWVPAVNAFTKSGTNLQAIPHEFVVDATGFDYSTGQFNQAAAQGAVLRGVAMVAAGYAIKWIARRA